AAPGGALKGLRYIRRLCWQPHLHAEAAFVRLRLLGDSPGCSLEHTGGGPGADEGVDIVVRGAAKGKRPSSERRVGKAGEHAAQKLPPPGPALGDRKSVVWGE